MSDKPQRSINHDELQEEHLRLDTVLQHLNQSARSGARGESFVRELHHVRERLQHHFAFEERGGYLHAALAQAVHLKGAADALLLQHAALLKQLDELLKVAEAGDREAAVSHDVVNGLDSFLRMVKEHEHHEYQLLQRAVNEEIVALD